MLYSEFEQKFAETKERVAGRKQSGLRDSKPGRIQAAFKRGGDKHVAGSYLLYRLGGHRGGGLPHAAGVGRGLTG